MSELAVIGIPGLATSGTATGVGRVSQTKPAVANTATITIFIIGLTACDGGVIKICAGSGVGEYSVRLPKSF